MNKVLWIALVAIMMAVAPPISGEAITDDVEIRGAISIGDITYDYCNFAGFWYDLKKNRTSETMVITTSGVDGRTIAKGDLVYHCAPQMVTYKSPELNNDPELGKYKIIGFMAQKYIGHDNQTDELAKLLIEWGGKKDKTLTMDTPLGFPEGYALHVRQIDLEGCKCILGLYKDGGEVDSEVVVEGEAYKYLDDNDVLVFSVFVDTIFRGTDSNMVVVKYVFLRSETILSVNNGDVFGVMKVKSTSDGITLRNKEVVTLRPDSELDIMDGLYFKVADASSLRYYLAKQVSLVCRECREYMVVEPCPPCDPCPSQTPCPEVTPEVVIEYVTVPATPDSTDDTRSDDGSMPGFEAVFAIVGLLAVAYIVLNQRE
jgi:S-layer protein (TIGR01567 family)